jgi:hypothetical protein
MNKEFNDSLQVEKDGIISKYIMEADKSAKEIKKNGDLELSLLRNKYENSKQDIVEKIFSTHLKNV